MNVLDFNTAKPLGRDGLLQALRTSVDLEDIKARLNENPRGFVEWLFSGRAFCTRREARVGDVMGTPGQSLSISLTGSTVGLWHDHNTGESGDLIGLYMANMGYTDKRNFSLALKEIASEFLGDPVPVERPSWQPSAKQRIAEKKTKLGDKPRAEYTELGAPVAVWKYKDLAGNIVASVERYEPDGTPASKTFRPWCHKVIDGALKWVKGAPDLRPLYNLAGIAHASNVVLVEGEKAAQALIDVGIDATTAMQGAEAPIDKTDWSPLNGKTVTVWPDNDDPGHRYAKNVMARLAAVGCKVRQVVLPDATAPKWDAADCVAEGKDAAALIAKAVVFSAPEQPKSRIRLLSLRDMETMPPLSWLIRDIVTEGGLSMIWGRSGSLKSFVALDMAMSVATGRAWHGREVKKGCVVYVAAEGAFGLAQRAIGWRERRGDGGSPDIFLVPHGLTLILDAQELVLAIHEAGLKPSLIVIDTMSRTFGGGNPNQPSDMNAYVSAADTLKEATSAHVMIVHHAGEDEDKNEIGNKGLRNACDTVIHIKRSKDHISLVNEAPKGKQKDAEEFKTIQMRPVKVAYQQDGQERSTLLLNLDDTPSEAPDGASDAPEQKLGPVEKKIVTALQKAKTPLGATRISALIGTAKGTVYTALQNLTDKLVIEKVRSEDDQRDEWKIA